MSTTILNVELPKWLNDSRSVEQILVRVLLVYLTGTEVGVI